MSEFPRRNQMLLWTEAEKAINDAVQAVERAGASMQLTDAVMLLCHAKDAVADHVEGVKGIRRLVHVNNENTSA